MLFGGKKPETTPDPKHGPGHINGSGLCTCSCKACWTKNGDVGRCICRPCKCGTPKR